MNRYEHRMLEILREGKANCGIVSVKAEFEAEGTRVDELLRLLEIARRADVKVGVKIGGCEAIRDLMECRQFGVDYIIAPMIETPYALSKFVLGKDKIFPGEEQEDIKFLFNVETQSTYDNLAGLADVAGEAGVGMVLGRVDFAGSLGKGREYVDSDEMLEKVLAVAAVARERNVEMVMGGGVSAKSIEFLRKVRATKLDRFETRKIIFDGGVLEGGNIEGGLALAIEFELLWLKSKRDYYNGIGAEDAERIAMMEARQSTKAVRAVA